MQKYATRVHILPKVTEIDAYPIYLKAKLRKVNKSASSTAIQRIHGIWICCAMFRADGDRAGFDLALT
jgi:hypothetical protein